MSATKVGIVYATGTKIVTRIIFPDNDAQLSDPNHVTPGETMLQVPNFQVPAGDVLAVAKQLVFSATGVQPPSGRACIIDSGGNVVGTVMADPALYSVAGHTVVASDVADVGWSYVSGGFVAPSPIVTSGGRTSSGVTSGGTTSGVVSGAVVL